MPSCAAEQATPVEQKTEEVVRALLEQALCVLGTKFPRDDFTLLEYVIRTQRCYNTKVEPRDLSIITVKI